MQYHLQKSDNISNTYNQFLGVLNNLKAAQSILIKGNQPITDNINNFEVVKTNAIKIKNTTKIQLECSSDKIIVITKETIENCIFNTILNDSIDLKEHFFDIGYEYLILAIEVIRVFQINNQYNNCDYLPFFSDNNQYNLYYDDKIIDLVVLTIFLKTFFQKSYEDFTQKVKVVSLSKKEEIEKERYYEDRLLTELLKPK